MKQLFLIIALVNICAYAKNPLETQQKDLATRTKQLETAKQKIWNSLGDALAKSRESLDELNEAYKTKDIKKIRKAALEAAEKAQEAANLAQEYSKQIQNN